MSQAIIDFCQGLQRTLLGVEERLGKAKQGLDAARTNVAAEAKEQIEAASDQLTAFRTKAAEMATAIRADLPEITGEMQERLQQCGLEAQMALRHAAVFMAETASKGADSAASTLKQGAEHAQSLAETLRHDTAVTVRTPGEPQAGEANTAS